MSPRIALPKRAVDISGQKFSMLKAIKPVGVNEESQVLWEFLCDCGSSKILSAKRVRSRKYGNQTKSCGCLRFRKIRESFTDFEGVPNCD